jgi:large subunit ribosomal protein L22
MPGVKTNEIPGTRAVLRHSRMSAYKVREVLDLIRGQDVSTAAQILRFSERDAAREVGKLLASAVANAENNDSMDPSELYVSTCYADEGATIKRWRPRARGRASRIRKRTCHVTVIVSRLPEDRLARLRAREAADQAVRRARRVAGSRPTRANRRGGGGQPEVTAAEAAAIEESEGLVDEQAAGIAAAESASPEELAAMPASAAAEPVTEVAEDQILPEEVIASEAQADPEADAEATAAAGAENNEEGE